MLIIWPFKLSELCRPFMEYNRVSRRFDRGQHNLLHNISRAGHLIWCDFLGYVTFYQINKFYWNNSFFIID